MLLNVLRRGTMPSASTRLNRFEFFEKIYFIKIYFTTRNSSFIKEISYCQRSYQEGRMHGDDKNKEAEAEESHESTRAHKKLRLAMEEFIEEDKALEGKRKQEVEELNKLREISSEICAKIEELKTVLSEKEMENYRLIYHTFLNTLKMNLVRPKDRTAQSRQEKKRTTIKVRQGDNLQSLFDRFLDLGEKDHTFLFRELDFKYMKGFHNWRLFLDWDVQFETSVEVRGYDNITALGFDGTTAQFLSDIVWKQLGDLAVTVKVKNEVINGNGNIDYLPLKVGDKVYHNDKKAVVIQEYHRGHPKEYDIEYISEPNFFDTTDLRTPKIQKNIKRKDLMISEIGIKLFEHTNAGVIPVTDEMIVHKNFRYKKYFQKHLEEDEVKAKAKVIYRAVGRIMLHCISHSKIYIPVTALPSLFRNILVRGIGPERDSYHKDDLIKHLSEFQGLIFDENHYLGNTFDSILADGDGRIITKDNIFTELIPKLFVESRCISLEAMKEGLTLNGMVPIDTIFSVMPIEVVDKLLFSSTKISAEDVINILSPKICRFVQEGDSIKPVEEALVSAQVDFFENIIPDVLYRKGEIDNNYISRFVQFCTGLPYLPDHLGNPDFKIIVEFNFDEMVQDSLPLAHTRDHVFKIPGWAYNNDTAAFETHLDRCLELASKFSMM